MQKYAKAFLYISKLNLSYQKKIFPYQQQQQQQKITLSENFVRIKKSLSYKEETYLPKILYSPKYNTHKKIILEVEMEGQNILFKKIDLDEKNRSKQ